ncbi:acyl-CoA dehydrogenase family protein [Nonomuraea sp. NPDC049129]|uniref:acyl-CoA dehydrogenase family protein n=1 Tax=Nonomuraea sp. NPDC049129 TaxID=3155272 RepID=UPI0033C7414C
MTSVNAASELAKSVLPVVARYAAEADRDARFPTESLRALGEAGLMGMLVPAAYGGLGGNLADFVSVAKILAPACLSTAMIWAMHCQQTDAIVIHASERLRDELLPAIAEGSLYLASVTTEPEKGGRLFSVDSPLTGDGTMLTIDRNAPVVTGGGHAGGFLITMRASEDAANDEISLVYAHRSQLEIGVTGDWNTMGMRGTESIGLKIRGDVPSSQIVGVPGGFRGVAMESAIPVGILGFAACWLGAAQGALMELLHLARSSTRPKSLDISSDLVAERLARSRIDLELINSYLLHTVTEVESARAQGSSLGRPATQIHLNTLKIAASELVFQAIDRLLQLAGLALGYSREALIPLERHFRDLRSARLNNSNDRLLSATGSLMLLDRVCTLLP